MLADGQADLDAGKRIPAREVFAEVKADLAARTAKRRR